MNERKQSGAAKKIEGSITEALGKLTGDKMTEDRGAAKKLEGEADQRAATDKQPGKKVAV